MSMVDAASRLWHLVDNDALLSHFELTYPKESPWFELTYPQKSPWRLLILTPLTASQLIDALFRQRPPCACPRNAFNLPPAPGNAGSLSVAASALIPTPSPTILFPSCKCLPNAWAPAFLVPPPAVDPLSLG